MKKYTTIPFLPITSIWISGISLSTYYPVNLSTFVVILFSLMFMYVVCFTALRNRYTQAISNWVSLLGWLTLFMISYGNTRLYIIQQQKSNFLEELEVPTPSIQGYKACIKRIYSPSPLVWGSNASVTHIKNDSQWRTVRAPIQLYFSPTCNYKPEEGDELLILGSPYRHLSLYPDHLQKHPQYISTTTTGHHLLKKKNKDFILLASAKPDLNKSWPKCIYHWCIKIFKIQLKDEKSLGLIEAILFGNKNKLDPFLRQAYINTGTIHLLVVSGLHVGMLYSLLHTICAYIFTKLRLSILAEIITLTLLWLYAGLCNFSSPILRATLMITIAKIGILLQKNPSPYNGLFASAFILLIWNPLSLYNIGFQLSYAATLGILYLYPPIYNRIALPNFWLQKIWGATSLSLAAQISTLPLTLYYFKQIPVYFIIANWITVPSIFALIVVSLALLIGNFIPFLNTFLSSVLTYLIGATNSFVCWVSQWPVSVIHPVDINGLSAIFLYIMLIFLCLFLKYKHLIYLAIVNTVLAFFSITDIQTIIKEQNQCSFLVHNHLVPSFILTNKREKIECHSLQVKPSSPYIQSYQDNIIASWHGKSIFAIGTISPDWYNWTGGAIEGDYLLIKQTLLKDLGVLCKIFNPKTVVIYSASPPTLSLSFPIKTNGLAYTWLYPNKHVTFRWAIER